MPPRPIMPSDLTGLPDKYAAFVVEYVKDFSATRAAEASGYSRDHGYILRNHEQIAPVIASILTQRLELSHITAEWVTMQAAENHMLARQQGSISASNTALAIVGKSVLVDAFAAEKIEVSSERDMMERLLRGRARAASRGVTPDAVDEVSFID